MAAKLAITVITQSDACIPCTVDLSFPSNGGKGGEFRKKVKIKGA